MHSPRVRSMARRATVSMAVLILMSISTGGAAAFGDPFVAPIPPTQMEIGDTLPVWFVLCSDGYQPTQTAEEAAADEVVEAALKAVSAATDPS